eukprot:6383186-Amphidinium_carterae.1
MTSYQFMLQLDRGTISDSDDDGDAQFTIFADRMGNEYFALSRKRCNVCKNSDYPVVLTKCILCKHHVHGKPGFNQEVRTGHPEPDMPNRYPRCGGITTVGGDIICLKCARTHPWIKTERWCVDPENLGRVWSDVPQPENELAPQARLTREQLRVMSPEDRRQMDSDDSDFEGTHACWFPESSFSGFHQCERRNCRRYACGAHSFSIFLPDGSMTAIWCSAHRRPMISNRYLPFRKKSCCKCGSDSNVIGCMFEGCDHHWCRFHCMKIDGEGVTEGMQAFWCSCHKTTIPQDCAYSLRCGEPEEGECDACADPRAFLCEYDGLVARHRLCQMKICYNHCRAFRDEDGNITKIWCNDHTGERPGKYGAPTRRCTSCYTKKNVFKCEWP